jgi:outer membrane protein TolC
MLLSGSVSSYAQQDSLYNYLEIAASKNPAVLKKYYEYQAALQKVPQVGSLPDPELSIGVFLKPMELMSGNQTADLRLMQMFPWFGVLKSAKDEMSLMANAKYEVFRDAKLQVCYDVQQTWFELYKIQKQIEISKKNVEILKSIERLTLTKFSSPIGNFKSSFAFKSPSSEPVTAISGSSGMQGMGNVQGSTGNSNFTRQSGSMQQGSMGQIASSPGLSDIYRIRIEESDLENNIEILINQLEVLTGRFNSFLNRPYTSEIYIPEVIYSDSLGLSLMAVSDSMFANSPMLGMLAMESKSLDARKKMVTRMGFPMVGLGLNYSIINRSDMSASAMNGKDMIMPMVTVTLPVYRRKYSAMQKEAEFLKSAAEMDYQSTANTLQTEYLKAAELYKDAGRRVVLYEKQSVLASKSLELTMKGFSVSATDLSEVLRARQQTLDYEIKKAVAVADFNTAIALLRRLGNLEIDKN